MKLLKAETPDPIKDDKLSPRVGQYCPLPLGRLYLYYVSLLPSLLSIVFAGYFGGCAGSTAGCNKIIRDIMAVKLIIKNLNQLIHPQGVFVIKYQNQTVHNDVHNVVMAFLSLVSSSSLVIT